MFRREHPPAEVAAALGPDERVIAWGDTADSAVVATPKGLWWPERGGHRLIGWERISKATWRSGSLTVVEADVIDDLLIVDLPPVHVDVIKPRNLAPTVRKRVETNIAHTELIRVGGGAARVVGRRIPGRDGLVWWARLEPGTRDSDATRGAINARIDQLRAVWTPP